MSPETQLTLVALEGSELEKGLDLSALAQLGGGFDFLNDEPELYSDADITPENLNPHFEGNARR